MTTKRNHVSRIAIGLAAAAMITCAGCAGLAEKNYLITGETRPYYVEDCAPNATLAFEYGSLHLPHDACITEDHRPLQDSATYHSLTEDVPNNQTICIHLNRCFVKYLEETGKPEVLAYVEVEDGVGSKPIKNVFFQDDYQPQGALLNFQDPIIYGPTEFKGQPITIRFYIYELDREENKVASAVLETVTKTAESAAGPYGLLADLVGDVVKTIINTNVDDREFFHQITLTPAPPGLGSEVKGVTPLRTGTHVIVKKELGRNVAPEALIEFKDELDLVNPARARVNQSAEPFPNIICMGGELYIHREVNRTILDALDESREKLQKLVDNYLEGQAQAQQKGKTPPSPVELFDNIDKEVRSSTARFTFYSAATLRANSKYTKDLAEMGNEVINEEVGDENNGVINENYGVINENKGVINENKGVINENKGVINENYGVINENKEAVNENKEAVNENKEVINENGPIPFSQYTPYRNKSYLTFTIVNGLPAVNQDVLNELYTAGARQIEAALNTKVDGERLSQSILEHQKKASEAIVTALALRKLQSVPNEDLKDAQEKLNIIYDGHSNVIEDVAKRVRARRDLRGMQKSSIGVDQILKKAIDDLLEAVKAGDGNTDKLLADLSEIRTTIDADCPDYAPIAKPILDAAEAILRISKISSPKQAKVLNIDPVIQDSPQTQRRLHELLTDLRSKKTSISDEELDDLEENIRKNAPRLWPMARPLINELRFNNELQRLQDKHNLPVETEKEYNDNASPTTKKDDKTQ